MTRKPNFTSSDPGAQGGALGLKLHGTRRSRAGGCSGDGGGGVRIVPLNAWARLLVGLDDPSATAAG
jgi:hypothetical protein